MHQIGAGDIVRCKILGFDMLVIGRVDVDGLEEEIAPSVFCVWEREHFLHEQIFKICDLDLVRVERRRFVRDAHLSYPQC